MSRFGALPKGCLAADSFGVVEVVLEEIATPDKLPHGF